MYYAFLLLNLHNFQVFFSWRLLHWDLAWVSFEKLGSYLLQLILNRTKTIWWMIYFFGPLSYFSSTNQRSIAWHCQWPCSSILFCFYGFLWIFLSNTECPVSNHWQLTSPSSQSPIQDLLGIYRYCILLFSLSSLMSLQNSFL